MKSNLMKYALAGGIALTTAATTAWMSSREGDAPTTAAQPEESTALKAEDVSFQLSFKTHLDMGLPEQDVYIERVPGSGKVYRATKGDNNMNAQLYRTATPTAHNPFDPAANGPYAKGEALGFTLGQWLRHQGTATYKAVDGVGTLELSLSGLVPNGVYTIWHAFMAMPPTDPFSGSLDLPLGARDGSESVFVADEYGNVEFVHTFTPGLQMSDVWTTSMIAINYHSDGKTYKAYPGDFGTNAHIPLFVILPEREGIR